MSQLPYSCIIGAGSSGITTAKALLERGLPFDCFDRSDDIGGNWYFNNPNKRQSAPIVCCTSTRRSRGCSFPTFRCRTSIPTTATTRRCWLIFAAMPIISACASGSRSIPASIMPSGRPTACGACGCRPAKSGSYDALFVCNGHHWNPRWPEPAFPGTVRRHGDALALLSRRRAISRQERADPRHGQ